MVTPRAVTIPKAGTKHRQLPDPTRHWFLIKYFQKLSSSPSMYDTKFPLYSSIFWPPSPITPHHGSPKKYCLDPCPLENSIFFFQVLDVLAHCHLGSCFPNISEETLVLRNVSEQKGLIVRIFGKCFMYGTKNSSIWIFGMIEKKYSETHWPGTYIWEILTLRSTSHFHHQPLFICHCVVVRL